MTDYGIKISKPGIDVKTASPEDLVFSSKYKSLKIQTRGSGTLTNGSRTATIAHGMGYVPLFLVHVDQNQAGSFAIAPDSDSSGNKVQAYADSTNLYIKADNDYGKVTYFMLDGNNDSARDIEHVGNYTNGWAVGAGGGGGYWNGATRFPGVNETGSVYRADLNLYILDRDGAAEVKTNVWGIDEDDTGEFDTGGAATTRTKTTATVSHNTTASQGNFSGVNVTGIVNEILGRGGWSSGNALGIMFWDNDTAAGNGYYQIANITLTNLNIIPANNLANYKYTIFKNQIE